jgi:hypothetical protein
VELAKLNRDPLISRERFITLYSRNSALLFSYSVAWACVHGDNRSGESEQFLSVTYQPNESVFIAICMVSECGTL